MSGVAAIYGSDAKDRTGALKKILSRLRHRGPDESRIFAQGKVALGHQTKCLSVSDHQQPLVIEDGLIALVSDAEIYNKVDFSDSTQGNAEELADADIILKAYQQLGPSCPKALNGMFSFVIYDKGELLTARDPLGILPLYWGRLNGQIVFASELKALVGLAENIEEFPPGHYFHSVSGLNKYFDLPSVTPREKDFRLIAVELNTLLINAVKKRIKEGVPTGLFLSGGLDSSIIAAIASEFCKDLKAFSVGMEGCEDLPFAQLAARHVDIEYYEHVYDINEVLQILPRVIYYLESFDAPLVRSAIPNYIAARLAKDKVNVVLIGEGGDENFGGYHHLKQLESAGEQHQAFLKLFRGLHNNGFMRTDRMNTAHSLVARAPFFDEDIVSFALGLHPNLKIRGKEKMEKWILRKAFENTLPQSIVWRPKKQFARGCGSDDLLTQYAERQISDETFEKEKAKYPNADIRWKEELLYFQIFREYFGDDPSIIGTVGRWYE